MAVDNKKLDDHPKSGNKYLHHVNTDAAGNYTVQSIDTTAMIYIKGKVHADGSYSSETIDHNGNKNTIVHGGEKHAVDSSTSTVTGHQDHSVGAGQRVVINKGRKTSVGGGSDYTSVDGPSIEASAESKKTLSEGGDGHHAMSGDQSFIVDTGGIHFDVSKDFTVTSKGDSIHLNSDNELSVYVGGNEGHSVGKEFSLNAATKITLTCGASKIEMSPGGIVITASSVQFVKA